ncbi:MAG: endonuclease/exonuclease/phosphatase family protein, partial [Betaproteobacteria bacterium]|nr:endonuclease/exonuclease/phosphatase family protein [Betaproteobacteria bacterium]
MLRIITLNLNGIRSAARKGLFSWLARQRADVICVQEVKAQAADMTQDMLAPGRFKGFFHYADKRGYSGVGLYSRHVPAKVIEGIGIADIDREGRYLRADFDNLSVISVYLPSGSSSAERQQVKFGFMKRFFPHLRKLKEEGREIVLCGDWNIAHKEIDLKNWRGNQ